MKRVHPGGTDKGVDELKRSPRLVNPRGYVYKGLHSSELIKATVSYMLKANQFIEKFF
jgi:hypothetical protein